MFVDITVTLGPASWHEEVIAAYLDLGVTTFRLPFSKETPSRQLTSARLVRQQAAGRRVAVVADLPGSKPRFDNRAVVAIDNARQYVVRTQADPAGVPCDFSLDPPWPGEKPPRGTITVGDHENEFVVEESGAHWVRGRFRQGGLLERRRSFLSSDAAAFECFTYQDREYARHARDLCDSVALSFASDAIDVTTVRDWLQSELNWTPTVIAKIETGVSPEPLRRLVAASDRVLIGRGDLAADVGFARLWPMQKAIVRECQVLGRHVTVGTGVLQSMRTSAVPSRAECIDVAVAVELGVNGFMLSAETAVGAHPVKVVETLLAISRGVDVSCQPPASPARI